MARQYHVGIVAFLRHDRRNAVVQFPAIAMQEHAVGRDRHLRVDAATTGVSALACFANFKTSWKRFREQHSRDRMVPMLSQGGSGCWRSFQL